MFHQEIFGIVFFFGIFMLATLATGGLRARLKQALLPRDAATAMEVSPVNPLVLFLGPFSRSALALLFTSLGMDLLTVLPWHPARFQVDPLALKGWTVGWSAILLFGLTEGTMRSYCLLRKRPFPMENLILSLLRAVFTVAVIFLVLHFILKVNVSPLLTSTAIVSAAVGLALKEMLVDLLDGMIMHLSRTIVPSDWVAFNNIEGEVLSTSWHETRIRTTDGHIYVVPNSVIARALVHNMTWPDAKRRHTLLVPVSYADSVEEVVTALTEAAQEDHEVLSTPPPEAFIHEFHDYGVVYKLRFWSTRYYDRSAFQGRIANRVWYQFKRRRIEIPVPVSGKTIFNLMGQERRQDPAPSTEACLVNSDFFRNFVADAQGQSLLESAQIKTFADTLHKRMFGPGEVLFRQGETGQACFILLHGRLKCRIEFKELDKFTEYEMEPGTLFGEISLVTGLPRTATVTALSECHLLEITQESMARLFELNATIPEHLARLAAERLSRSAGDFERLESSMNQEQRQAAMHPDTILQRLRRLSLWQWGHHRS